MASLPARRGNSSRGDRTVSALRLRQRHQPAGEQQLTCTLRQVAVEDVLQQRDDASPAQVGLCEATQHVAAPARRAACRAVVAAAQQLHHLLVVLQNLLRSIVGQRRDDGRGRQFGVHRLDCLPHLLAAQVGHGRSGVQRARRVLHVASFDLPLCALGCLALGVDGHAVCCLCEGADIVAVVVVSAVVTIGVVVGLGRLGGSGRGGRVRGQLSLCHSTCCTLLCLCIERCGRLRCRCAMHQWLGLSLPSQLRGVVTWRYTLVLSAQLFASRSTAGADGAGETLAVPAASARPRQHALWQHEDVFHRLVLRCAVVALAGEAVGVEGQSAHRHPLWDVAEADVVVQRPVRGDVGGRQRCACDRHSRESSAHSL